MAKTPDGPLNKPNPEGAPATKLKEPSILLAGANCQKLIRNLSHVLDEASIGQLKAEVDRNAVALFKLGEDHLSFAQSIALRFWRQRVSRLYYAAFNVKRAITLNVSGDFYTDVSDHKKIGDLPKDFPTANTFATRLQNLRDDRNLCDYSHIALEADLILSTQDAAGVVTDFVEKSRIYLAARGLSL